MLHRILKPIFFNTSFERELSVSLKDKLSAMDDLMIMAPRVFSYRDNSNGSASTLGAFSRTSQRQTNQSSLRSFVKVEKKVVPKGIFSE
mmetsp:Transcript_12921/g.24272  ORF Transcript_12921/g.24272 Transcript_12921/m.24272 type:complete len:89 (-) Transcript_12921:370-636(-)